MAHRRRLKENDLTYEERDQLARVNLGLTYMFAKRYSRRSTSCDFEECLSNAMAGLERAVRYFDPGRGFKFSTYASWWIRQSIERGIGVAVRHGFRGMVTVPKNRPLSLNYEESGDPDMQGSVPGRFEPLPEDGELWGLLLRRLPPQHRRVVEARFAENRTLEEVAGDLGVSRERVRQVECEALHMLRRRCRKLLEESTGRILPFVLLPGAAA